MSAIPATYHKHNVQLTALDNFDAAFSSLLKNFTRENYSSTNKQLDELFHNDIVAVPIRFEKKSFDCELIDILREVSNPDRFFKAALLTNTLERHVCASQFSFAIGTICYIHLGHFEEALARIKKPQELTQEITDLHLLEPEFTKLLDLKTNFLYVLGAQADYVLTLFENGHFDLANKFLSVRSYLSNFTGEKPDKIKAFVEEKKKGTGSSETLIAAQIAYTARLIQLNYSFEVDKFLQTAPTLAEEALKLHGVKQEWDTEGFVDLFLKHTHPNLTTQRASNLERFAEFA